MTERDTPPCFSAAAYVLRWSLSDRENLVDASPRQGLLSDRMQRRFLSVLGKGTASVGGLSLDETSLFPLERLLQDLTAEVSKEGAPETPSEDQMTEAHISLEELLGDLVNSIMNPAIPFEATIENPFLLESVSKIYAKALKDSTTARKQENNDPSFLKAKALLFEKTNAGEDTVSAAWTKWIDFGEIVDEAEFGLLELRDEGNKAAIDLAEKRVQRLKDRWLIEGRKVEIENAVEIWRASSESSTFSDERLLAINNLESTRIPIHGGGEYYRTRIQPLRALLSDEENSDKWKTVSLNSDEIVEIVANRSHALDDDERRDIEKAANDLDSVSFSYLICTIQRNWFSDDFVAGRFWQFRDNDRILSDGRGKGTLPAIPVSIIFTRNISFKFRSLLLRSETAQLPPVRLMMMQPKLAMTVNTELQSVIKNAGRFTMTSALSKARDHRRRETIKSKKQVSDLTRLRRKRIAIERATIVSQSTKPSSTKKPPKEKKGGFLAGIKMKRLSALSVHRSATVKNMKVQAQRTRTSVELVIEADATARKRLSDINLALISPGRTNETLVNPKTKSGSTINYESHLSSKGLHEFIARDADGDELLRLQVNVVSGHATVSEKRILSNAVQFEIADDGNQIVYGYITKLVPRSPNPDKTLDWS